MTAILVILIVILLVRDNNNTVRETRLDESLQYFRHNYFNTLDENRVKDRQIKVLANLANGLIRDNRLLEAEKATLEKALKQASS